MSKYSVRTPRQASRRAGPIDHALATDLFKALCDPTRARLLACLAKCGRPCSVGELAACSSVDLSVVSRHLALLARAGVLDSTRHGRTVSYVVRYSELARSLRRLADAIDACCPPGSAEGRGSCCIGRRTARR